MKEASIVKLSIVILCWNDQKVIIDCLDSIFTRTHATEFEVIVSDNGSTDGSPELIRQKFPLVRVIENRANLRFSKGNNVGIEASSGEYVLILNPDTIVQEGSLDRLVAFADAHPDAGGFGCRILNPDGSYQRSARPFPTIWRCWISALGLAGLGRFAKVFTADEYLGWNGDTVRPIDWQSGCCLLVRSGLLKQLGGFDDQFQYYYEDVDLCRRIWGAGHPVLFTPSATVIHLGGQSTSTRFPVPFELDKHRNRYRYFYKYFGQKGARSCRRHSLTRIRVRQVKYGIRAMFRPTEGLRRRMELYRAAAEWNRQIDPVELVQHGREPETCKRIALQIPQ